MIDLADATILLTGGTGSFGVAFVERVLADFPTATVRVFSRDELKQSELRSRVGDRNVRYLVGDIRDLDRLRRAASGCDVIVHAAAMKQVPACEYNPFEAVHTNVLGAQHVVEAAIDNGVGRVLALSTDKAVNPVNVYGATKLCAEKIIIQGNAYVGSSPTRLACLRYGNVLGSRGSVVHLFKQQATSRGRLTLTDRRMTRFCVTLNDLMTRTYDALGRMRGGEAFIPKSPSMQITDLAEAVCPGLPHDVVGIRPGEKLHEVLLTADEARHSYDVGEGFVVLPEMRPWSEPSDKPNNELLVDRVDEGFSYASDTNDRWLDVEQLRSLLRASLA